MKLKREENDGSYQDFFPLDSEYTGWETGRVGGWCVS